MRLHRRGHECINQNDYDHKNGDDYSQGDDNGDLITVYMIIQQAPIKAIVSQTSSGKMSKYDSLSCSTYHQGHINQ